MCSSFISLNLYRRYFIMLQILFIVFKFLTAENYDLDQFCSVNPIIRLATCNSLQLYENDRIELNRHSLIIATEEIKITDSNILYLNRFFDAIPRLKIYKFYSCRLTSIGPTDFYGLIDMEKLYFGYNPITKVPDKTFESLINLKVLNLAKNDIIELFENSFYGLEMLERLNLDRNQISVLPQTIFHPLKSLQSLSLASNQLITPITSSIFNMCIHLNSVNFIQNNLTEIHFDTKVHPYFVEITADRNQIKNFTVGSVGTLTISHNRLENVYINGSVDLLDVSRSKVSSPMDITLTNTSQLEHAWFRGSLLTDYSLIKRLNNVIDLSFTVQNGNDVDLDLFSNLISLQYLRLQIINVKNFNPKVFDSLKTLRKLDFTDSNFRNVDFQQLRSLNLTVLPRLEYLILPEPKVWDKEFLAETFPLLRKIVVHGPYRNCTEIRNFFNELNSELGIECVLLSFCPVA